jgi:hypothetical protein
VIDRPSETGPETPSRHYSVTTAVVLAEIGRRKRLVQACVSLDPFRQRPNCSFRTERLAESKTQMPKSSVPEPLTLRPSPDFFSTFSRRPTCQSQVGNPRGRGQLQENRRPRRSSVLAVRHLSLVPPPVAGSHTSVQTVERRRSQASSGRGTSCPPPYVSEFAAIHVAALG